MVAMVDRAGPPGEGCDVRLDALAEQVTRWVSSAGIHPRPWRHAPCPASVHVIVAGARTPIGRLLGGLKSLSAADLGGVAIKGALEKAGVTGDQVDYLIMGQVILAGAGQNPAREAAGVAGGLPMDGARRSPSTRSACRASTPSPRPTS